MTDRWLPLDFELPTGREKDGRWVVHPIKVEHADLDYWALMDNAELLSSAGWMFPADLGITWPLPTWSLEECKLAIAFDEMGNLGRCWLTYVVHNEEGTEEKAGFYIWPSFKEGYKVMLHMWSTEATADIDQEIWEWVKAWMLEHFPWTAEETAYPGREIPWDEWEALPEAMMPVRNIMQFFEGSEVSKMV